MKRIVCVVSAVAVAVAVMLLWPPSVRTQTMPSFEAHGFAIAPATGSDVRVWDNELTRMERSGALRLVRARDDTVMAGRRHQRFAQYIGGVPVFGAEVTRQTDLNGNAVSILGALYRDGAVETAPRLTADDVRRVMLAQPRAEVVLGQPRLTILPLDIIPSNPTGSGLRLAYRVVTKFPDDILVSLVDALSGQILLQFTDLQRQAAVGTGVGVLADFKKISTEQTPSGFRTSDELRPPAILTFDLKGNVARVNQILAGIVVPGTADLAVDADNDWVDFAVVDAHVYSGWTYDYYFKRFGRRGLDNNDLPIRNIVHPVNRADFSIPFVLEFPDYWLNAFWSQELRLMLYGEGLPPDVTAGGQQFNFFSGSLDIVAHELTHGVTQFSSDLIYLGESGALNEAFSDIMATGAEFFFAAVRGRPADYLIAADVITPGGIRSMSDPEVFDNPDHYSNRWLDADDGFGVHINSGIPNHAFYLAIEGGTNRTSGLSVQGVGGANREQIERVFYRAFTLMLPSSANFFMARQATIQSARDLFGANSAAERAVTQAWDAVGVQTQAARIGFLFAPDPPVPPAPAGLCALPSPNFFFEVAAPEIAGVGFNVTSSTIRFYNAAGALATTQPFNFAQVFSACGPGSNRIPPAGFPCAALCVSFGGASGGFVDFTVAGVDDLGNQATFTSPRLSFGTTTATPDAAAISAQPSWMVRK
jgi:Zn-dependent metalloprotease